MSKDSSMDVKKQPGHNSGNEQNTVHEKKKVYTVYVLEESAMFSSVAKEAQNFPADVT